MTSTNSGASQEAIEFHYDMPAEFFALWLGETMTYTAARYSRPDMTLTEAQADKIAFHLDCAKVREDSRMLDVGCGWGTLLRAAVTDRGAASAHGLTLSPLQRDYITGRAVEGVSAELCSYEHFTPPHPYDAIVSVGAFEHFAKPGMTKDERIEAYDGFFSRCAKWMTRDGHLSLQTITWGDASPEERERVRIHEIFPESDLPEISEVAEAAAPHLELVSMENRPLDYGSTLQEWADRLKAAREQAIELVGPERYNFYMMSNQGGAVLFRRRRFYLCRFAFRQRGR